MVDYAFYRDEYGGEAASGEDFYYLARRAQAQLDRYKRIYHVTAPLPDSEQRAMCAMVDAMQTFRTVQSGALAASVSVGSVSSSMPQQAIPDVSPEAQARELYRCAQQYLDIYRGPGGGSC